MQPWRCDDLRRMGCDHDGGYLVNPRDLESMRVMLSLGVGENCEFERHCHDIYQIPIVAYDEPGGQDWPSVTEFFVADRRLTKQRVGTRQGDVLIKNVLSDLGPNVFVKCDIEGSEWEIMDDILAASENLQALVIEVHDIQRGTNQDLLCDFVARLPLRLIHLHVNNYCYYRTPNGDVPDVLELTFSRSPNVSLDRSLTLPHRLDQPNNPQDREFSFSW